MSAFMRSFLRVAALVAFVAPPLRAQTVRGTVVDQAGHPVSGVVVMLVDSGSAVTARTLSDALGNFRVATGRAGTYRLRTMRIGYRPTQSDAIKLLLGGESTTQLTLSGAQVALDTIRVVDRRSCAISSDSAAAATFAVWEQVRTALTATQLTASSRAVTATTVSYERAMEPDAPRIRHQRSSVQTAYVTQPWRTVSTDSLRRAGYVVTERNNTIDYYAPGLDVLLSDVFLEDHCFRLVNDRKRPTQLGLAFDPSPNRKKLPEIRGTLWLDRKSAQLDRMEYRYVNVLPEQESAGAGGELDFARMRNGGWAVSRWSIRMPVLEQSMRTQAMGGIQNHVVEIQIAGGELALATVAAGRVKDTIWSRPPLVLSGTVVDSASGAPVENASIFLDGTTLSGNSDTHGRFSIGDVLPGSYMAYVTTPALAAIGAVNQTPITFLDSSATLALRLPNAEQLATSLCGANRLTSSTGMIVGSVRERGDTTAGRGTPVIAEWTDTQARRLEARTDQSGFFRMCGVPVNSPIVVRARTDSMTSDSIVVRLAADGRFGRADFVMVHKRPNSATFAGIVRVDSSKTPLLGVEVAIVDLSQSAITDGAGAFHIADIPAGAHHVTVRRIGYSPLDTTLTFAARQSLDRQIYLAKVVMLDAVNVRATSVERSMQSFEDNRKLGLGHFLTRADLEKQEFRSLGSVLADIPGVQLREGFGNHKWVLGGHGDRCPPAGMKVPGCDEQHGVYFPDSFEAVEGMRPACYAKIYQDGVLLTRGNPTQPIDLSTIPVSTIESVEYYRGSAEMPMEYTTRGMDCGVLVLHTRVTP
jgi:protocatechuate 3,4-dioxygenase beta subunit